MLILTGKRAAGEGIHIERHLLTFFHPTDISLRHGGLDLHLGEVVRHDKQRRGIHAGGDGLTGIYLSGNDDAIHGGVDRGPAQIHLGAVHVGHPGLNRRFRLEQIDAGLIELGLGNQAAVKQLVRPVEVELGQLTSRLGIGQFRFGLAEGALVGGGIDLSQHVAGFDAGIEVRLDRRDRARNLAANLDHAHGSERTIGRHRLHDVALGHLHRAEFHARRAGLVQVKIRPVASAAQDGNDDEPFDQREAPKVSHLNHSVSRVHDYGLANKTFQVFRGYSTNQSGEWRNHPLKRQGPALSAKIFKK